MVNSLSRGQGDRAVQGRLRYADSRDESRAAGFAELDTASLILDRTVESSLIKCGLFPVFSSCSITPTTISSLMPSVSTLLSVEARGEGGGVCSYATRPLLLGRSAKDTALVEFEVADDFGLDGSMDEGEVEVCDLFIFFAGGC